MSPLAKTVADKLKALFSDGIYDSDSRWLAEFQPICPGFGAVVLQDGVDEITVFVGRFTHVHFECDDEVPEAERFDRLAEEVGQFLTASFADEIECFGGVFGGGLRRRDGSTRGAISRLLFGRDTYVWSGSL